jgi:hypothetical protein
MFAHLLIAGSLQGQTDRFKSSDNDLKRKNTFLNRRYQKRQVDKYFSNKKSYSLSDRNNIDSILDLTPYYFYQDSIRIRRYPDFVIAEETPRINRFYNFMPVIVPDKRGKILIKKPDQTKKYYLIIKDPIRQTLIK